MTQTTEGAFELIENMAASSANKQESDCSKKRNSVDTQKINELTSKVDQMLKKNQGQIYFVEETTREQAAQKVTAEAEQGNKQNPTDQSNQQAAPATVNSTHDELKGLKNMMHQLLQSQQIQVNALNQATTGINTRMDIMFTELNTKYDTVSSHMRQIDVQLAQTAESVKRQQGTLLGKIDRNTRECNALELRRGKKLEEPTPRKFTAAEKGKQKAEEQPAEDAPDAEQGTQQTATPEPVAPEPVTEAAPARVYVPKVPYPITSALPTPALKVLPKVDDPGKFIFPCSIAGADFKDAICDSGSCVNLVSKAIIDKLGIVDVERSQMTLAFANSSKSVPYGVIRNLHVQVGGCIVPAEFQVVEMNKDHDMPLIFGRTFMATVGAIIDMPNKRVSFSNINKKVFYKAVPTRFPTSHASCISAVYGEKLKDAPEKEHGDTSEIRLLSDGDPHTDSKKLKGDTKVKDKVQKKRVKGDPTMTLIPHKVDENFIEYGVKCKGISKPFSKVRVILTHELKEKGEAAVKGLLSRVLKLNMSDCGACFGTGPHAQPD